MLYELNNEQKSFQKRVEEVFGREVAPLVDEYEHQEAFPTHLFPILGREGLLCLRCPVEYGGPGLGKIFECIAVEELNRICGGIGSSIMVHGGLATDPILFLSSNHLKRRYLPPAVRGERIGAFAMTEPNAGSDTAGIQTTALKEGKGFRLSGSKTFITNGTICDFVTVAATTDPDRRRSGIHLFLVEKGTAGFSVVRKLRKLGNHSSDTGELSFQDCFVPEERLIGAVEQLDSILKSARITYGARSTGLGRAAFDVTISFFKNDGPPLAQAVRFSLAEMSVLVDTMRCVTHRGAWLYDQGLASMRDASVVKLFCTESVQQIVSKAMSLQKQKGLALDNPVQRILRDARLLKIPEGTSEIQHLIIAKELGI